MGRIEKITHKLNNGRKIHGYKITSKDGVTWKTTSLREAKKFKRIMG